MSRVTVVIPTLNGGESLRLTIENMQATLPPESEIVVVDDGSTDGSADFLEDDFPASGHSLVLLRPFERLGVSGARNLGARYAHGDVLVFSDAHVIAPDGWCEALMKILASPGGGAAGPAIGTMSAAEGTGYGQKWNDASLTVEWLGCKGTVPYPVPLLSGCFLAIRRALFEEIGGFDPGMMFWGCEDSELSLHLWLLGYECRVAPGVEVRHAFQTQFAYEVGWPDVLNNRLRLASVHFGSELLATVLRRLKQFEGFSEAAAHLLSGEVEERRNAVRAARRFDDDWFFDRFHVELKSELSEAGGGRTIDAVPESPTPVVRPIARESVSACLISWKRPENLLVIAQALRNLEFIDEILIWNNNTGVRFDIPDQRTRVIQSDANLGCYGRFACAALARNQVVYVQDDDALNDDIIGLYRRFLDNPSGVAHALARKHWFQRHRHDYGNSQSALIGWGAFFRKEWLSVLDEVPEAIRETPNYADGPTRYNGGLGKPDMQLAFQGYINNMYGQCDGSVVSWNTFMNYYFWMQACVDFQIGRILYPSPPTSLLNEAVVVFLSDHGDYGGSHNLHAKGGALYDEAINVPLYVSYPPMRPASYANGNAPFTIPYVCSMVDVLPFFYAQSLGSDAGWRRDTASNVAYLSNRESILDSIYAFTNSAYLNAAQQRRVSSIPNQNGNYNNQPYQPYILTTTDEFATAAVNGTLVPPHAVDSGRWI